LTPSPPTWSPLPWDTEFFGVKTTRIYGRQLEGPALAQALAECRAWGSAVVHFLAESDDDASIRSAEQAGFQLVDIRVTLAWNTSHSIDWPDRDHCVDGKDLGLRSYRQDDLTALKAIATRSYYASRFYRDPRYPRDRVDALYAEWITKSCREAGAVLVIESDGLVSGYVTCELDKERSDGRIGLLGVAAPMRGRGTARRLVRGAQQWFRDHGVDDVHVITQASNISAQRVYQRCGFLSRELQLWYHKWLS
jgi:dTDP-4-amino-4,6-dideoxy-D-galactose acyltransferase